EVAGNERGARLVRGEVDLAQPAARPGRQQAQVVADLRQLDGEALHARRVEDECLRVLRRLDEVGGEVQRQSGNVRDVCGAALRVSGRRIQAGTDRGRAHVDLAQHPLHGFERTHLAGEGFAEGVEL